MTAAGFAVFGTLFALAMVVHVYETRRHRRIRAERAATTKRGAP